MRILIAAIFLVIAFGPMTLADHEIIHVDPGVGFGGAFVAWSFIIGYPLALITLIGGCGDER